MYAIDLKTGQLKWIKKYNDADAGPNGVTVANGIVYGATAHKAFALQGATGEQLWSKDITVNHNTGIDMAPGIDHGTVYYSTVPGTVKTFTGTSGQAILYALDAKTGKLKWKWNEAPTEKWNPKLVKVNRGGGQWYPPSFDDNGDIYVGTANPGPAPGTSQYPFGSSRDEAANLYTDSVVKIDHKTGKVVWYYQLTPHDIEDWDLQDSPILTKINGKNVVLGAGKAGIVIALDQNTGKLLWQTPVGTHNGHDHDGLLTLAQAKKKLKFPFTVYPGIFGGVESQMATDGQSVFAAVNNLPSTYTNNTENGIKTDVTKGTGELVSLNQKTGKILWQHKFATSPYGAAAVTNDVVFTTTFDGSLWAFNTKTGKQLAKIQLPAGSNATVAIAGDTVITAASVPLSQTQVPAIVAYRLPS